MHIVVRVKEIPDPEIAPSVFRVDEAAKRVVPLPGLPSVISPFDEQALASVPDLKRKLMRYIRHYNKQPKPVEWKHFDSSRRIAVIGLSRGAARPLRSNGRADPTSRRAP